LAFVSLNLQGVNDVLEIKRRWVRILIGHLGSSITEMFLGRSVEAFRPFDYKAI
jgi:hypothetical protein